MSVIESYKSLPNRTKALIFVSFVLGMVVGKLFSNYLGGFIDGLLGK
ncbi:MAG: hypothetical protein MUF71_16485 [Candidatus Kapabacteria bacterium]|jgi:hypothetical protein|nr:hypothetical protein [Candidatus Kapabacteria bacterium]